MKQEGIGSVTVTQTEESKYLTDVCRIDHEARGHFRDQVPGIVEKILESCGDRGCFEHVHAELIPSRTAVIDIVERLRHILFPGYFGNGDIHPANLRYHMGQSVNALAEMLAAQITRSLRHECQRYDTPCVQCVNLGYNEAVRFLSSIPQMRKVLSSDVRAAYDGDPAAKSYDEIVFSYPGVFAIMVYRIAHQLFEQQIPLLPRIMTEYAHSITGIDIHPGATIGERFFIDHGTGVVIGETTIVGRDVRVYQGVTLGALSLARDEVETLRTKKRHPSIEDEVIIYAGATILGGDTTIGARSVIGGNVWITESVPADTTVFLEKPRLIFR
jgi:serine O-acetyltransferase